MRKKDLHVIGCLLFIVMLGTQCLCAQVKSDSAQKHRLEIKHPHRVFENIPKSRLWGNSWYFAGAWSPYFGRERHGLNIELGRALGVFHCGGGGCVSSARTFGFSFQMHQSGPLYSRTVGGFVDAGMFFFPPFSVGVRAEYLYDIYTRQHFIRPAGGLWSPFVDVYYHYSFPIQGGYNPFRHGLTVRLKFYTRMQKWMVTGPDDC